MTTLRDLGWWYWFLTMGLLGTGLLVRPEGIFPAMALCVVQTVHVFRLTGDASAPCGEALHGMPLERVQG